MLKQKKNDILSWGIYVWRGVATLIGIGGLIKVENFVLFLSCELLNYLPNCNLFSSLYIQKKNKGLECWICRAETLNWAYWIKVNKTLINSNLFHFSTVTAAAAITNATNLLFQLTLVEQYGSYYGSWKGNHFKNSFEFLWWSP